MGEISYAAPLMLSVMMEYAHGSQFRVGIFAIFLGKLDIPRE